MRRIMRWWYGLGNARWFERLRLQFDFERLHGSENMRIARALRAAREAAQ